MGHSTFNVFAVGSDESGYFWLDDTTPPRTVKNAVMPDTFLREVFAHTIRDVRCQSVRGFGLSVARDVIFFALDS